MNDPRIVPCERCGSEGRLYSGHANDPNPRDEGVCPVCEGTGGEIIETGPITLDDLCADGCQYAKDVAMHEYSCGEECQYRLASLSTGQLFNALLGRINFDGADPRTFSLAEIHGAIEGAEWPTSLTSQQPSEGE